MHIAIVRSESAHDDKDQAQTYITNYLIAWSELSHLLFFIHQHSKANFIPIQNYRK